MVFCMSIMYLSIASIEETIVLLSIGAVVESKANLVGIHDRVRSDLDGKQSRSLADTSTNEGGKRVATVTNPSAEDAAALLRYIFAFPWILLLLRNLAL